MRENSLWKVKRELRRLGRNSQEKTVDLIRKLYFRRYYDSVTKKEIVCTDGAIPLGNEVAIYLIFPSDGLLESHIQMLSQLGEAGISSIVVTNILLTDTDRVRLAELSTRVVERPNIGYDFGGYRDGIFQIRESLRKLDRVWLINDSAWLLPQKPSWFDQARNMGKDFVGATSSFSILRKSMFGIRRLEPTEYQKIVWAHETNNKNFHYASYALCIGSTILQDQRFFKYWKNLDIRNNKKQTVRRGEIGLTQWVLKHGYTHGATFEIDRLDEELEQLTYFELERAAKELIVFSGEKLEAIKNRILNAAVKDKEDQSDLKGLILMAVARQGTAYALAIYMIKRHNFQFLKKSVLWLSADGPGPLLKFIDDTTSKEHAYLAAEARMLCAKHSHD